jgi:hypothetical protein
MSASYIVYIDHMQAKLFKMSPGGVETTKVEHEIKNHGHEHMSQKDKVKDAEKMFHEVANKLKDAGEVLVVGHGTAKDQFVHHLRDHKHHDIEKKIVGVETVDHPTDKQIVALGAKFFRHEHVFKG